MEIVFKECLIDVTLSISHSCTGAFFHQEEPFVGEISGELRTVKPSIYKRFNPFCTIVCNHITFSSVGMNTNYHL